MGALFEEVRAGDSAATAELHRLLRAFARQICRGGGPPGAAAIDWEDVAQECGRKLLAGALGVYRGGGSERSYLYSVVKVTVLEMARATFRRRRREALAAANGPVEAVNPNRSIDVRKVLSALDRECREVIQRVILEDERYADVARDLGLEESSVRARLSRCLGRARRIAAPGVGV